MIFKYFSYFVNVFSMLLIHILIFNIMLSTNVCEAVSFTLNCFTKCPI